MRILKSRRGKDGYNYHTCPLTGENVTAPLSCKGCPELDHAEYLEATYRVHCNFDVADELIQIKPAKAASKVPASLGGDPLKLRSHTLMEPKLDGVRIFMHIGPHGNRLTTRRKNKEGLYNEVTDQLPHLAHMELSQYAGTILDGEILMPFKGTSAGSLGSTMSVIGASPAKAKAYQERYGYVRYKVFDMLFSRYKEDLRTHSLVERRMHLGSFWLAEVLQPPEQKIIRPVLAKYVLTEDQRRDFTERCLRRGYEGAILKDLEATYGQLRGWIKIKEKHTLDLQIVGWDPGKIGGKHEDGLGSLLVAARRQNEPLAEVLQVVCTVSPGTDVQREYWFDTLSNLSTGEIHAANFIVEVEFQNWTKEYRLRHPRVLRYRPDRSAPSVVDFSTVKRS